VATGTSEQTVWSLSGNSAELSCGNLSGQIDTTRPHRGLCNLRLDGALRETAVLGVKRESEDDAQLAAADQHDSRSWPLTVSETYVRGNDLVATYQPASNWPFAPQLYWRANPLQAVEGVLSSVSLLVSVQTQLLDTCPQIGVVSRLPGGDLLFMSMSIGERPRIEPITYDSRIAAASDLCCVVLRIRDTPFSYIEITPASDFRELTLSAGGSVTSWNWRLFADFLEKGVIRRSRVHAALLPRENDIEIAPTCCAALQQLELPLTT